jgi:hypothetical protein
VTAPSSGSLLRCSISRRIAPRRARAAPFRQLARFAFGAEYQTNEIMNVRDDDIAQV